MKRIIVRIIFALLIVAIPGKFCFSSGTLTDPPVAKDDTAITNEDLPLPIDVLENDTDPQGNIDPATVQIIERAVYGTLTVSPFSGLVIYTPAPNYYGTDTFVYEVCDTDGFCDQANVNITINPINDSIVAVDDFDTTQINTPVTISILSNDIDQFDPWGVVDPESLNIIIPPLYGSIEVDPFTKDVTYTPLTGFFGTDFFAYEICDNGYPLPATCDIAKVVITVDYTIDDAVEVPNGFSPNGDGVNDFFVIPGIELFPDNELTVYNRWGSKVYSAKGYDNSWDGKSSNKMAIGEPLAVGTYYYVLTLGNGTSALTGYVYINR